MRAVRVVLCGLFSLALMIAGFAPTATASTIESVPLPVRAPAHSNPEALPDGALSAHLKAPASVVHTAEMTNPVSTRPALNVPWSDAGLSLAAGPKPSTRTQLPLLDSAWTVSLTMTAGSSLVLTATTNYSTANTNDWIIIYDTTSTSSTQYLKYCNGGTTCTVTTVPGETGARYVAVVMPGSIPSQYPTSGTLATSNAIFPSPWTVTLVSNIGSAIGLTATTNYSTANTNDWIIIYDTTSTS